MFYFLWTTKHKDHSLQEAQPVMAYLQVGIHAEPSHRAVLTRPVLAPVPSMETLNNNDSEISWGNTEKSANGAAPNDSGLPPPPPPPEKDPSRLQAKEISMDLESQTPSEPLTLREKIRERRRKFKLSPRMISDAIIGISDGMTVPFALTAGLATFGSTRIVILGGLAELVAGAISMGLGGFIGAKSEAYAIALDFHRSRS